MSGGQHPGSGGSSGPSTGAALIRGLLLIAVAVALGVVLLGALDEPVPAAEGGVEEVTSGDVDAERRQRNVDEDAVADASEGRTTETNQADDRERDDTDPDDTERGGTDSTGPDDDASDPDRTEGDDAEAGSGGDIETEGGGDGSGRDPSEGDAEGTGDTAAEGDADADPSEGEQAGEGSEDRRTGQATVLVANGSGVAGRAAEVTEEVGTAGFRTAAPSNVNDGGTVPASTVYYARGFEADAAALAETLSPRPQVAELPEPAPVSDLRGAQILLVVGPDLADD